MKKLYSIVLALFCVASAMADNEVTGVFNNSASGTTSATMFVKPAASDFVNITDMAWRLDSGVTTGLVFFRSGDQDYASTSATSASGTTVWFTNTGTPVSSGEYIIIQDVSTTDFYVRQVQASTATSVTVSESISPALTTSDKIWSVVGNFSRPVNTTTSPTSGTSMNLWFPKGKPTAISIEGNTTACRISVSGITTNYR